MINYFESGFVGLGLGLILGLTTMFSEQAEWRRETVERGLAQYCPTTGEWAWKGECGETDK